MNKEKKSVLFVCLENSCRSQIAEGLLNKHAGKQIEAYSAGSTPSGKINPKALNCMNEIGYDLSSHSSKSLEEVPDIKYEWAITMGCGDYCPQIAAKHREDWKLPNPADFPESEFASLRNLIEKRVVQLIDTISKDSA